MDNGEIKEFASPKQLLQDSASMFYNMAKHAGVAVWKQKNLIAYGQLDTEASLIYNSI